jgi:hypothetical protein
MGNQRIGQRNIFSWQNIGQFVIAIGLTVLVGWLMVKNTPSPEKAVGESVADTVIVTPARANATPVEATILVTVTKAIFIVVTDTPQPTPTPSPTIAPTPKPTLITGSHSQYLELPGDIFLDMDLSPDSQTLVVAGYDGTWLYQIDTLERTPLLDSYEHATSGPVSWATDSRTLAIGWNNEIRIVDTVNHEIIQELAGGDRREISDLNWSPTGRWLFSRGTYYSFWEVAQQQRIFLPETVGPDNVSSGDWSPDGNRIALGTGDGLIVITDMIKKHLLDLLAGDGVRIKHLDWSPDSQWLASANENNAIRIWHVESNSAIHLIEGITGDIQRLAWSGDSHWLASAHSNGIVLIWDANSGQAIYRLWGHEGIVSDVVWLPDGRLISLGREGTLRIWQIPAS